MKIFSPTISGSSQTSGSLTISGSLNVSQGITGSLFGTASWAINVVNGGGGGSTNTGSLLTTASVVLNTITFTKGDGSTFPITVNTGSGGGGGSVGTLAQVTALGASTTVPITASIISASSFTGSLFGTASWATNALTASFLPVGTYNITASWAQSASNAINARTASFLPIGTYNITASWANNAVSASNALTASFVRNAVTASYVLNAVSSSFATTASHALNGGVTQIIAGTNVTISPVGGTGAVTINSSGGGGSIDTGSLLRTASVNLNTITFTKGDGSTFPITVNTGSGGGGSVGTLAQVTALGASTTVPITASIISASSFTGSLFGTASWATNALTASFLPIGTYNITASWAQSASNAINARTASFVNNLNQNLSITGAVILSGSSLPELLVIGETQFTGSVSSLNGFTGSLFGTSSWATNALTASFLPVGTYNITSSWAQSASNAINARTASFLPVGTYSITSSWATNALTSSFINNLNQNLSITGAVILSGSSLPELRVIGETQFTGSVGSTGGFTGSLLGTASWATNALTASFLPIGTYNITSSWANNSISSSLASRNLLTASVSSNTITFTKGDGSTFNITINTGSGGGGSVGTLQQVTEQGASTTIPITASIISASSLTGSLFGTASWALNVVGGGGGGGVTINNNVDNYLITATGTANTLNGESGLTFDGTTLTVANNAVITAIDVRNDPSTTIGQYAPGAHMGRDWPAAGGPALTAGNIVYFSGSSQWTNAQANATGSSTRVLGVVTDNEDPNEIVLQGTVTINTDLATYQIGQPVYLSPLTAGKVTNIPPSSSGHVARYVGWVVDTSRDQIYFNPDFTYIQL
jgi:hypothetical protein